MKEKATPEMDILLENPGLYQDSQRFGMLLDFIKRFPHLSPGNALLIHMQKPDSRYVATATDWRLRFGRSVKAGAIPILIAGPAGRPVYVFELEDTDGEEPFPGESLRPAAAGALPAGAYDRLILNLSCDGILCVPGEGGAAPAGQIKAAGGADVIPILRGNKQFWLRVLYHLPVDGNHPHEIRFIALSLELAHLYCGHLGWSAMMDGWTRWPDRTQLAPGQREFEAETVRWLLCGRMGLANPSEKYLRVFLDENQSIPPASIGSILKTTETIEDLLSTDRRPLRELVTQVVRLGLVTIT